MPCDGSLANQPGEQGDDAAGDLDAANRRFAIGVAHERRDFDGRRGFAGLAARDGESAGLVGARDAAGATSAALRHALLAARVASSRSFASRTLAAFTASKSSSATRYATSL